MATKMLISLGRHPVNSLQVGQMIRFQSRCFVQEMVLTIRRLQWLKDKVIISGDEANDVVLSVYDWMQDIWASGRKRAYLFRKQKHLHICITPGKIWKLLPGIA